MTPASLCLALALLAPLPALAQTPLTAAEFEAFVSGKTLTYATQGEVYGAETYLPGRKVVWHGPDEGCVKGSWTETDGQLCFVYDDDPAPICWTLVPVGAGLEGQITGDPPDTEATVLTPTDQPVPCDLTK
ncbi:hypothetical protein [Rhodobacter ferrooxidans]|uniref:Uncharacterized protein n=1 Tax=Rhodobacter ferrooxidans TaxID=371731 RepID=C8S4M1_9RHOB|nr:hypothetical protein [Rhodobacter sp. SW2]EEW24104.1 conserved hypothetical protein [Rhodobacter sp. SW2]